MAKKTKKEAANEWGGVDYRGKEGLARTATDDGVTTVMFLSGPGEIMQWKAAFGSATPAVVIQAAVTEARRLADGR